jgi:hypothetical protein
MSEGQPVVHTEEEINEKIKNADSELEKYKEKLKFGTPEFLSFADGTAKALAEADRDSWHVIEAKDSLLENPITPEERAYNERKYGEANAQLRTVNETIRIHENSVPGYYNGRKDFDGIYTTVREAEEAKEGKPTPSRRILTADEFKAQKDPKARLKMEVFVDARASVARRFETIRTNILEKSQSLKTK